MSYNLLNNNNDNNNNNNNNIYIYTHTQGVSGGIVNILGGGSVDYSE